MESTESKLGRASASFAISAAICIVLNSIIACAKDRYPPLKMRMAALTGHDWTTQGLAVVLLFFVFGSVIQRTGLPEKMAAGTVIYLLVAAALVSGAALFAWYVLY